MSNMEIERKFLVTKDGWKNQAKATPIAQGYIVNDPSVVVRARRKGDKAFLTIKADRGGISRLEFEYEIPQTDVEQMLSELCGDAIEKTRYKVDVAGLTWEVDEFHGVNEGLVLAEVELESTDQSFEKPDWAGPEVSEDKRFFNAYIAEHPFSTWGKTQSELIDELNSN